MTWVLGQASVFDYGALVSDVRVTWGDGCHADVLQKIHPVGHSMLVGFAGSVELGFAMVDDMRLVFHGPPDWIWFPRVAAWTWWRRGRRIFSGAPPELRRLGCSLILVGVSAIPTGFLGTHPCAVLMRAPDFRPQFIRKGKWVSIGNGASHSVALQLADSYGRDPFPYMQTEQAGFGASVWRIASHITKDLMEDPHHSVSEATLIGIVSARGFHITGHSITANVGTKNERTVQTPTLITTWTELVKYSEERGLKAVAASAGESLCPPPPRNPPTGRQA